MKILALDTATEACSVALWLDGQVVLDAVELAHGHAQRILPMIDALLAAHALRLTDLDSIAVGCGPGGFTGLRLAISIAQGLALGADLPAVGVSNLAAVAQAMFDRDPAAEQVLVCNDARMNEVYTGLYRRGGDGLAVPVGAERVLSPDAVAAPEGAAVGAGRGFRAYPQLAQRLRASLGYIDDAVLPDAGAIVRLAAARLAAGEGVAADVLQPVYLRDNVAVAKPLV
jgi:tRNA threonylcarbamoyladenosine biosynthesis protein TsaB